MSIRIDRSGRFFTDAELRIIWNATNMAETRNRHRRNDTVLFALLTEFAEAAYAIKAVPGHEPRHLTAREEREYWTVEQLARASHRAARTIRHDIQNQQLNATRTGHAWLIPHAAAQAYIAGRQRSEGHTR